MVTSNHVHLLEKETDGDAIAQSIQLVAGRTGQEYNQRKDRHGAFWEDRYHVALSKPMSTCIAVDPGRWVTAICSRFL